MICQVGNEMWSRQFFRHPVLLFIRPLPVNEFEEIETDSDTVDSDQASNVLDVVDVTIERRRLLVRANQNRIHTDHATASADHLDLLIADVALDVVKFPGVRVGNNQRFGCEIDNLLEAGRIDVGQIDNDAELLAFADEIATE